MRLLMPRGARHLWSVLLWVVALLYGGVWAHASEAPYTSVGQASVDPTRAPHIALLLPTGSDVFAKPAEAVRAGFLEAAKKQTGTPALVQLYSATDEPKDVLRAYREAIAAGAKII